MSLGREVMDRWSPGGDERQVMVDEGHGEEDRRSEEE